MKGKSSEHRFKKIPWLKIIALIKTPLLLAHMGQPNEMDGIVKERNNIKIFITIVFLLTRFLEDFISLIPECMQMVMY